MNIKNVNVMTLAHKVRKALNLEGNYAAQMKYAMQKAWAIKKGQVKYEDVVGIVEEENEAACTVEMADTKVKITEKDSERIEDRRIKIVRVSDRYCINQAIGEKGYSISYIKDDGITYSLAVLKLNYDLTLAITKFLVYSIPEIKTQAQAKTALFIIKNKITKIEDYKKFNRSMPHSDTKKAAKEIVSNKSDKDLLKKYNYIMTIHDGGIVFVTNRKGVTTCKDYSELLNRKMNKKQTEMFIAKNISKFPKGGVVKHTYDFFGEVEGISFIREYK